MICASAGLSAAADFPGECKKLIFVDHNHPYLSATVQLLDRRCYLIHKTTLLLALLFCYFAVLSTSSGIAQYCQENIPVNDILFYLA